MSTYFQAWGSTVGCHDPATYTPENKPIVGKFCSAQPVRQGLEGGTYTWNAMTIAEYEALWDRWYANQSVSGSFKVPDRSGSTPETWRTVTAFGDEPSGTFVSRTRQNVTMHITITG